MDSLPEKPIEEHLSRPILLSERVRSVLLDSDSFKLECSELSKLVDKLSQSLRATVRFSTNSPVPVYDRPVRRVVSEVTKSLEKTLALVKKCKRRSIFHRMMNILSVADFRKCIMLLEASIGDMKWMNNCLFEANGVGGGGAVLSLPPIASNDPILAWVWSLIATVQMGQGNDRVDATNQMASLARDNDRNKKLLVEEGCIPPLLRMLKDGSLTDGQMTSATVLVYLCNCEERVRAVVDESGIPLIVPVLGDSPMGVQIKVAELVARMAEFDKIAKEDFARENVIRPLVSLLSFETFVEDLVMRNSGFGRQSIHSLAQVSKEMDDVAGSSNGNTPSQKHRRFYSSSYLEVGSSGGSSRGGNYRKERENEKPEVKLKLKISCAEALWMLARESVSNSKRITETKGLLCLAKLVETEKGELQFNCLMALMEISASAESNPDLRRSAFKTNSPAAKAVVDQLLRLIKEEENPALQIPAIRSIGSLSRTFPARETRIIGPLVTQLGHSNLDVATEAAISLGKFACTDNFLHAEHSKAIIESSGVPLLLKLLRSNDQTQLHGLVLLCYLAIHAGNSDALEQARVLTTLEGADRSVVAHHPELRELITRAIYHLNLYHAGLNPARQTYA